MWSVVVLICVIPVVPANSQDPQLDQHWELWKTSYNKTYKEMEEGWRRMVWEKNLKKIELHNLEHSMGKHSYRLGMNHFGDMTEEEFAQIMLGYKPTNEEPREKSLFETPNVMEIPSAVDWREKGYVTPVKDQGHCGSCWAFSATGALEGQLFKKTGKLVSLSEQNLVDCSRYEGNQGCKGGWMDRAFSYVRYNRGLDSEASYPYVGKDQMCQYNPQYSSVNVSGYHDIYGGSQIALMFSVASQGPISAAIDASDPFRFYQSGIYYNERCSTLWFNHAVLVVGYGFQNSSNSVDKYWIVKNSWSTSWGDNGYIYMAKDKYKDCGLSSKASYPDVY